MNRKNNDGKDTIIKVLDSYYASTANTLNSGCGLTYRIRNFSQNPIQVRSRFGYSQIIEPCENFSGSTEDYEREQNGVWLDVLFETRDLKKCFRIPNNPANLLDKAIDDTLYSLVSKGMKEREKSITDSFACSFGICLNSLPANYDAKSYFSETFGIIIELNATRPKQTYMDDTPKVEKTAAEKSDEPVNQNRVGLDVEQANYEILYLIDNQREINLLWTMRSGKPSKIKAIQNHAMNSGIYIYTSEKWVENQPYEFIPISEICDDKLREYGLSYTRKELLNTVRTKEYVDMVKNYEKRISEIDKECEKVTNDLHKTQSDFEKAQKAFDKKEMKNEREAMAKEAEAAKLKQKVTQLSETSEPSALNIIASFFMVFKKIGVLA